MKKSKLRQEAKGRECQIRIPHICNSDPETTVLCHPNSKSVFGAGIGSKPDDIFGAYGCSACHKIVDVDLRYHNGNRWVDEREVREMFYEGIFRTQNILLEEGKIGVL